MFFLALTKMIKDELSTHNYPWTLKHLENLVNRIDLHLSESLRERRVLVSAIPRTGPRPVFFAPVSVPDPEPVQPGGTCLSKKGGNRRHQLNLCFYCSGEGQLVPLPDNPVW